MAGFGWIGRPAKALAVLERMFISDGDGWVAFLKDISRRTSSAGSAAADGILTVLQVGMLTMMRPDRINWRTVEMEASQRWARLRTVMDEVGVTSL